MQTDIFYNRHIGPRQEELSEMLSKIGVETLDKLIDETVPASIRLSEKLDLPDGISEYEYSNEIRKIAAKNKLFKTYIGLGYYDTILPAVIQRNILENPGWYTSYTPYQAEISQGRLEALLNFQTVVTDLTGMEIANASLLDESTAAAEAMLMIFNNRSRAAVKNNSNKFFVDSDIFPQTLSVLKTRSAPLGIELITGDFKTMNFDAGIFGALVQYPSSSGKINDYSEFVSKAHANESLVAVAADIMSLVLLKAPGEWGADIVVGSTQRFGIPMGFGGPHAAFFATLDKYKRTMPGRIIGVTIDTQGKKALRLSLQTREQHIKRERATSNICTAQALLATMAGMYAVYHGAEGLKRIASNIHKLTGFVNSELKKLGFTQNNADFFDTLQITVPDSISIKDIERNALKKEINLRYADNKTIGISINETTNLEDACNLISIFAESAKMNFTAPASLNNEICFDKKFIRQSDFLKLNVFKSYHCESEMMRYIKKLERKDFSLTHSMISLGSCTMKLNAAQEMLAMSFAEFGGLHPFVPSEQAQGYFQLMDELGKALCTITGFHAISFQPNSGAAGEYAGLMAIQQYHAKNGQAHRNVVLIPASAHGTNPASAAMAGLQVVVVECDNKGNISIDDLKLKAEKHKNDLSCFMVTYPSTHGVFENGIIEMNKIIHLNGGQVYMDGANMNAQVGITNPAFIGADVCHLNLHKTFAIPHGGGGPGVGPICVAKHLAEFLPSHPVSKVDGLNTEAVAAAPYGSASVLTISHAYIKMMGGNGLLEATKYAILNANYLASSLKNYFDILYTGENGRVAHEMILDCRKFKHDTNTDISETDVAKRLMDYGFHAPTLSFPVHGTLMVEPTESESMQELNRFIDSMISIRKEIDEVTAGTADKKDNVLKNAPHTQDTIVSDIWEHKYGREKAAFPLKWIADNKFWPGSSRVDDAYGDRNLVCSCAPIDEYRSTLFNTKE